LWVVLANPGCNCCCNGCGNCKTNLKVWRSYIQIDSTIDLNRADSTQQLILWAAPGSSDEQLNSFLSNLGDTSKVHIARFCAGCDSALMLLTGPSVRVLIQSGTAGGGSGSGTGGNPKNGDSGLYYTPNIGVFAPEAKDSPILTFIPNIKGFGFQAGVLVSGGSDTTKVGLIDTGLDSLIYKAKGNILYDSKGIPNSCLGDRANSGYNFAYNTVNWEDDYNVSNGRGPNSLHGTSVATYIGGQTNQIDARQQSANKKFSEASILPVKMHDSTGSSTLFNVLCGFAYARDRQVQIINASFGFYAPRKVTTPTALDSNVLLLREYVNRNLTANHILLIAAAGNRDAVHMDPKWRNLDSVSFYPASLSRELDNVIAVTTLTAPSIGQTLPTRVSSNQNYSSQVVSIGVVADTAATTDITIGWFHHPFLNANINGSSFATPIVTGTIAAYYSQIPKPINRQNVLSFLQAQGIIHSSGTGTTQTLYYMTRK
jgi:hypothetical protein